MAHHFQGIACHSYKCLPHGSGILQSRVPVLLLAPERVPVLLLAPERVPLGSQPYHSALLLVITIKTASTCLCSGISSLIENCGRCQLLYSLVTGNNPTSTATFNVSSEQTAQRNSSSSAYVCLLLQICNHLLLHVSYAFAFRVSTSWYGLYGLRLSVTSVLTSVHGLSSHARIAQCTEECTEGA